MERYPITTKTPVPASEVPNPKAGHFSMFYDASNSNALSIKDSNGVVTEIGGSGGGADVITQNSVIDEASWSTNDNNAKSVTIVGAEVGDQVVVSLTPNLISEIETQSAFVFLLGTVTASDTVRVVGRATAFLTIPSGAEWKVTVIKQ